jgi:hypothetical protein
VQCCVTLITFNADASVALGVFAVVEALTDVKSTHRKLNQDDNSFLQTPKSVTANDTRGERVDAVSISVITYILLLITDQTANKLR